MQGYNDFLFENRKAIGVGLCVTGATLVVLRKLANRNKKRLCGVDYPSDTVILHGWENGMYAPSLGHFVMKLDMYLRVAKIPFQYENDKQSGPKNKVPWVEYNGLTLADSQLIMGFLNKELGVDLNRSLSPEQRAVAWGLQKWLEEFTYWLNVQIRWDIYFDDTLKNYTDALQTIPFYIRWLLVPMMRRSVKKMVYAVGIGRHSNKEIFDMMTFDLQQLSTILGDKTFLMGGEEPTEVDCAAFGMLSQIRWHTPDQCPGKRLMKEKLTNLMRYTDRIKERYWPDWDERTIKASTKT